MPDTVPALYLIPVRQTLSPYFTNDKIEAQESNMLQIIQLNDRAGIQTQSPNCNLAFLPPLGCAPRHVRSNCSPQPGYFLLDNNSF